MRRWLLAICAGTAPAALSIAVPQAPPSTTATASASPDVAAASGERVGATSCSGRGCHGAVAPRGTVGSEFTTWVVEDPHAQAYQVLFDCRSASIQRNRASSRGGDTPTTPAFADALCMSCHGVPDPLIESEGLDPVDCASWESIGDRIGPSGVDCESCHGNASLWKDIHYEDGWRDRDPEAAASMVMMRTAEAEAGVCVGCHVGDGIGRQVDHDLIAAGHPRLNFEFASYSDRMPKHWNVTAADLERESDELAPRDPASDWAIGQMVTLRAAVELAGIRASSPSATPWPEFAEYGCFGCHHALVDDGLRYESRAEVPGMLSWASWMLPTAHLILSDDSDPSLATLERLETAMETPSPDRELIEGLAQDMARQLDQWVADPDRGAIDTDWLESLLARARTEEATAAMLLSNWDAAAQTLLAARACVAAELIESDAMRSGADLAAIEARIEAFEAAKTALAFPAGHRDSPGPSREPGARSDDGALVVRSLKDLLDRLGSSSAKPEKTDGE